MANIDLTRIRAAREELGSRIALTPVWEWQDQAIRERLGEGTRVFLKLELFQHTGTFKARGALVNLLGLDPTARANGVTAVSAGNHAIAVSFCAARDAKNSEPVSRGNLPTLWRGGGFGRRCPAGLRRGGANRT